MNIKTDSGYYLIKFAHKVNHEKNAVCFCFIKNEKQSTVSSFVEFPLRNYTKKIAIYKAFVETMHLAISEDFVSGKDIETLFLGFKNRGRKNDLFVYKGTEYLIDRMSTGQMREIFREVSRHLAKQTVKNLNSVV